MVYNIVDNYNQDKSYDRNTTNVWAVKLIPTSPQNHITEYFSWQKAPILGKKCNYDDYSL